MVVVGFSGAVSSARWIMQVKVSYRAKALTGKTLHIACSNMTHVADFSWLMK